MALLSILLVDALHCQDAQDIDLIQKVVKHLFWYCNKNERSV